MEPIDTLHAFLTGTPIAKLGKGAEHRIRLAFAQIQAETNHVLETSEELTKLIRDVSELLEENTHKAEDFARQCFESHDSDPFLWGHAIGTGTGWQAAATFLTLIRNAMKVKHFMVSTRGLDLATGNPADGKEDAA